jgi:CheY-like chemotaxis protein
MKRILLIEDDDAVREMLGEILRQGGFDVSTAANGKEGIEVFEQQVVDLVVTDLFMPTLDGAETIFAIRRLKPDFKIIAISGGRRIIGPEHLESVVRHMGVNHFLAKPFTTDQLLKMVTELLNSPEPAA